MENSEPQSNEERTQIAEQIDVSNDQTNFETQGGVARASKRTKHPTERGRAYDKEVIESALKQFVRAWQKNLALAESALADDFDLNLLRERRKNLSSCMDDLTSAYAKLSKFLDPSEISGYEERYEGWFQENRSVFKDLNKKIAELSTRSDDTKSISSRSIRSVASRRSSVSSTGSSRSKRTEILTKAARINAKLKFVDIESERAAELKRINLLKELAVAQAEFDAVANDEQEQVLDQDLAAKVPPGESSSRERLLDYLEDQLKLVDNSKTPATTETAVTAKLAKNASEIPSTLPRRPVSNLNASATPFNAPSVHITEPIQLPRVPQYLSPAPTPEVTHVPTGIPSVHSPGLRIPSSESPKEDTLARLADLLSERSARDRLPLPEPDTFRGDLLQFPNWLRAFESIIESQTTKPAQRLYYLGKYTAGDAREAIHGYITSNNPKAYEEAKHVLRRRYGNPFLVADAYRKKIEGWQRIPSNDGIALRKFSDFLNQAKCAMSTTTFLNVLNDPDENQRMIKKLPVYLQTRWAREVDKWIEYEFDYDGRKSRSPSKEIAFPPFSEFCRFLEKEARIACNPVMTDRSQKTVEVKNERFSQNKTQSNKSTVKYNTGVYATETKEGSKSSGQQKERKCAYCKENHDLDICDEFVKIPITERREFVISKRLCWGCLRWGHTNSSCRKKKVCRVCNENHPTAFHGDKPETRKGTLYVKESNNIALKSSDEIPKTSNCIGVLNTRTTEEFVSHSLIVPVWLHHEDNPHNKVMVYALLDEQSDACFIKDSILKDLNVSGPEVEIELSTVLARQVIQSRKVSGLIVRGVNETAEIPLPKTYTRDLIPARKGQIPRPESARQWPHLESIADSLLPLKEDVDVAVLIGTNCTRAIKPREIIPGRDDDPYAKRTALGWGIVGVISSEKTEEDLDSYIGVNRIVSREVYPACETRLCNFAVETKCKEVFSPNQFSKMLELDFNESKNETKPLSHHDRIFIKKMEEGIYQREDGHFELPLPLKNEEIVLPNNKLQAISRLNKLKQRMQNDVKYREDYSSFMNDMINNGFAESVPQSGVNLTNGKIWYLPHHGVYHPKKPDKIRVVFDCSAQFQGESLNRHLLQGPDLTNSLLGVLCRFRQEKVAVMCDIEAMFYQVYVKEEYRDLLRFLWWPNGDFNQEPIQYRMTVHLFGATSSPGCANTALKATANIYETEYGKEAANFIRKDFYVDDGLKSVSSPKEAIALVHETKKTCSRGGFRLHKFISNSKEVLESIVIEDRAKDVKDLDFSCGSLPVERALGVQWCIGSDSLQFRIQVSDRPFTRRGVLSTVCSIFDPLGVLAPFVLVGKCILQELCRGGASWDDPVPESLRPRWDKWRKDLHLLADLKIPRCYKPESFKEIRSAELHSFSDASNVGYGQCAYLRLTDVDGNIHCSLVMAKSRVTPLRSITIPRLELTAALVSTKVSTFLQRELEYNDLKQVFWSDSKAVLGYISNDARRFHVFVANRVQQIRDLSFPEQWHYVDTKENPADYVSRGLHAGDLINKEVWWNGPDFLWAPIELERTEDNSAFLSSEDPEMKKISALSTSLEEKFDLEERLRYFSSWFKAKRAVAVCLRMKKSLKARVDSKKVSAEEDSIAKKGNPESMYKPVNVEEIKDAEREITKVIQRKEFGEEIATLMSKKKCNSDKEDSRNNKGVLKKTSSIYQLDPFLDENGILRVGGRIRQADEANEVKHPCILPKKSYVSDLIVRHYHESIQHQGRGMTHNAIRSSGHWIIGGRCLVRSCINKCVKCQRLRGSCQDQKMCDLPKDRLEISPPFTYAGVDYFGPWLIKEKRKELKRYGVLFTCMSSRAVHLEIANFMDTCSFINAYRRFVARRGPVRQLRSDCGSNFIGCKNDLKKALAEMDQNVIRQQLLKDNCDWVEFKMNVPHASHMGGSWERQIRTVRSVLSAILDHHGTQLDDESLRTFMVETEAIINCRPLTVDSCSELEALTPNHLLTMKAKVILPPPGVFQREDLYLKKRWRRVQYLANQFWDRWRKEFLSTLQCRQKWQRPRRNLQIGDIVLMRDEDQPRNKWPLACVSKVYPDEDNLVRKVQVAVGDRNLNNDGQRSKSTPLLDRPVQKLVLLMPVEDRGIPAEEP